MGQHYSLEKKKEIIALHKRGLSYKEISIKIGVNSTTIRRLIMRYNSFGSQGLERLSTPVITLEFKKEIVDLVLKKSLSCEQTSLKYKVGFGTVSKWVRQVQEGGYKALTTRTDYQLDTIPPKPMGRPKKKEPTTEVDILKARIRQLEIHNLFLKKKIALEEKQERKHQEMLRKWSKNY